uniref:Uncharacterized protein n=1 Tax=Candidatus Kentrum sp. LPFa TaxID=2126335 RepID=A0A450WMX5_9GAMM|nr:MAG: hypothetical protein BECKLPF1236B_GA0070989_11405 [Candidatus Kentron sp. LPFa]
MIKRKNSNLLLVLIFKGIGKIKILVNLVRIPRSTPRLSWREVLIHSICRVRRRKYNLACGLVITRL